MQKYCLIIDSGAIAYNIRPQHSKNLDRTKDNTNITVTLPNGTN